MPLAVSWFDSMFTMPIPIWEKIVRTIAVYLVILVLLRLFGKRTVAQLNAFDLVVLLLLSNVVQNAIIGPDDSLVGGVIGVVTLLAVNAVVLRLVRRSERIDRAFEGGTTTLIRDGVVDEQSLRQLGIRQADLMGALHAQGAEELSEVRVADMYPSGAIVVDLTDRARDATRTDLARVERKIDDLTAAVARQAPQA
jgi:uncharacterized membrane protein YcaP (DUF421 family)